MIKNIIFDIGGVIFDDSDLNLSKLLNKDLEEVKKIAKIAYGGNFIRTNESRTAHFGLTKLWSGKL